MISLTIVILLSLIQLNLNAGDNPSEQSLQKKLYEWINERVELEKEQHGFHRKAHAHKLAEKRGMNIADGKYTSMELTFDDLFMAPDDPELWPLWCDWLIKWRKDKRKALSYDDSYYNDKGFAWVASNYVDGCAQPSDRATKVLLVWPGLDRRSTVGFRCVVDTEE